MKWILLLAASTVITAFLGSGCATSVDGRMTAAKDVLNYNGRVYSEDVMKSTIEASVNQRTVWVKVEPIDDKLTKVTVQARTKLGGGDVALASEIDKQIAIRLATGNLTPAGRPLTK